MKKYINYAFYYALIALAGGVFFREFTKWNGFSGKTMLGKVHTHLFVLGMVLYLIVALFVKDSKLEDQKSFKNFMKIYNIGLPLAVIMMVVRGVVEVLNLQLSNAVNASISGISGIGHFLVGAGIILLLLALKKEFNQK